MTPPPIPNEALAVASRMQDFSSRLSPMLVKELRQGLRTHLFTTAFILFQSVMVLSLLVGLADPSSPAVSGFFWFFVVVTLILVQPLRGFSALSSEYLLNTMDLIQLTRLDAWRITVGKWAALNAQTLLFVAGVLPYVAIRYFLGNVDFISDLVWLLYLTLGSGLASAITIGCSAFRNFLLRGFIVVVFGFGFMSTYSLLRSPLFAGGLGIGLGGFATVALSVATLVYGCFFFLSFGASRIAPPSENLATRKRLVALSMALATLGFAFFGLEEAATSVAIAILTFACIDALTEPLPIFAKVLEPFRGGTLRRLLAWLLAPGWISGIFYFLFCFLILAIAAVLAFDPGDFDIKLAIILISSANVVLFPLLLIHLLFPSHASGSFTFGVYCFIQACLGFVTMMVGIVGGSLRTYEGIIYSCVPLPSVLLIAASDNGLAQRFEWIHLALALLTLLLGVAFPLLRQRRVVRLFDQQLHQP